MSNIEEKKHVVKAKKLTPKEREKALEADIEGVRNVTREKRGMIGAEDMTATYLAKFLADDHDNDIKEMRLKIRHFFGLTDLQEDNLSNSASIAVDYPLRRYENMVEELEMYRNAKLDIICGKNNTPNVQAVFHMALCGILARRGTDKVDYDKDE